MKIESRRISRLPEAGLILLGMGFAGPISGLFAWESYEYMLLGGLLQLEGDLKVYFLILGVLGVAKIAQAGQKCG